MEEKDKIFEFEVNTKIVSGKLKIQNYNNRVIAKVGDIILDKLNYYRWDNAIKFLDKYESLKKSRNLLGKETPIPPKFLFDILDNAFLEDNHEIQELWANLLVNWQDAERRADIRMVYIEILKNFSANEIKMLHFLFTCDDSEEIRTNKAIYIQGDNLQQVLGFSDEEYELCMLNLFRMYCCEGFHHENSGISVGNIEVLTNGGIRKFRITTLGYKLLDSIFLK